MPVSVEKEVGQNFATFVRDMLKALKSIEEWAEFKLALAENNKEYVEWGRKLDIITKNGTVPPEMCAINAEFKDVYDYIIENIGDEYPMVTTSLVNGNSAIITNEEGIRRIRELQQEYAIIYGRAANELNTVDFDKYSQEKNIQIINTTPEQVSFIQAMTYNKNTPFSYTHFVNNEGKDILALNRPNYTKSSDKMPGGFFGILAKEKIFNTPENQAALVYENSIAEKIFNATNSCKEPNYILSEKNPNYALKYDADSITVMHDDIIEVIERGSVSDEKYLEDIYRFLAPLEHQNIVAIDEVAKDQLKLDLPVQVENFVNTFKSQENLAIRKNMLTTINDKGEKIPIRPVFSYDKNQMSFMNASLVNVTSKVNNKLGDKFVQQNATIFKNVLEKSDVYTIAEIDRLYIEFENNLKNKTMQTNLMFASAKEQKAVIEQVALETFDEVALMNDEISEKYMTVQSSLENYSREIEFNPFEVKADTLKNELILAANDLKNELYECFAVKTDVTITDGEHFKTITGMDASIIGDKPLEMIDTMANAIIDTAVQSTEFIFVDKDCSIATELNVDLYNNVNRNIDKFATARSSIESEAVTGQKPSFDISYDAPSRDAR